ncbi:MAG: hypothetical protein M1835_004321 [Candelina submexicana]|nr:MAG: hypothetical protein M1835_004321 [Candelina submexicana]
MPSFFEVRRSKLRAVFSRARAGSSKKDLTLSTNGTFSHWDTLPAEIQVLILSRCSLSDILNIRLVSHGFRTLIDTNQPDIARSHLRFLRHGSLPSRLEEIDQDYTHEPEDDMRLLSDLFPPPKTRQGAYVYDWQYLKSLNGRLDVCTRLSHHLAEVVMDLYIASRDGGSKKIAKRSRLGGKDRLQDKFRPSLFYVLLFFESYSQARLDHQNSLHIDYDSGRLPAPVTPHDRFQVYLSLQRNILSSPPFTHTPTLMTTHHTMHVLRTCLRTTISRNPGAHIDPQPQALHARRTAWISMLLNHSGLDRIAEFFAAERDHGGLTFRGGNKRREFMKNMERDQQGYERASVRAVVFADDGGSDGLGVDKFWFEAAEGVLEERGEVPDVAEMGVRGGFFGREDNVAVSCAWYLLDSSGTVL